MLVRDFRRWFPAFDGVPLETSWGGPIDVAGLHQPFFGTLPGGTTHYGLGFTGNGVGPCHLGGKILSGLALGLQDEATTLPISDGDRKRFPPEPLVHARRARRRAGRSSGATIDLDATRRCPRDADGLILRSSRPTAASGTYLGP